MNHLMVDLETMGNGPYAPVISIGAVFFDPNTGETGEEFSVNISLESSMRYRARPDASTILWWMEQSEEARKSLTSNTQELSTALSWLMSLPQETKEEKEFRHCIWLAEKEERERIYQTSIRPFRKATYTHFPEIDPRLRNYRSRYGAISND